MVRLDASVGGWRCELLAHTLVNWYPRERQAFRVAATPMLQPSHGEGAGPLVSLYWLHRTQVIGDVPWSVGVFSQDVDLYDDIDSFAFLGFYCEQALAEKAL